MTLFVAGQRWISETEPELGLATVVQAGLGRVQVEFKSAGETRTYTTDQAPLKRVRFRIGDKVKSFIAWQSRIESQTEFKIER